MTYRVDFYHNSGKLAETEQFETEEAAREFALKNAIPSKPLPVITGPDGEEVDIFAGI